MKTFTNLLLILVFSFTATAFAQDAALSANTKALLLHLKNYSLKQSSSAQISAELKPFYPVIFIENQVFIGALIKAGPGIDEKALANLGVRINTRINQIWSVIIPLYSLEKLKEVKGLIFVEADCTIKKRLDNATTECNVKQVHAGTGLQRRCYGDSVVIGIVDGGFDYTHPNFYDTAGARSRIVRAWEQDNPHGPAPSGFTYGTEFVTSQAILEQKSSGTTDDHGSHVAGIAGGSGYLTPGLQYMGVAPAADLVFVNTAEAESAIADGINYVFQYASSAGRPAVANLSLGSHIGPHDGTSAFDQAIDGLSGNGRIVVGAASNEGDTPLHLAHAFNNDTVRTFMNFENSASGGQINTGRIDQWGSAGSDFSLSVSVFNQQGQNLATSPFYAASRNPELDTNLMVNGDTIHFQITGIGSSPLNLKPNLLLNVVDRVDNSYRISLCITSSNSRIDIWNDGTGIGASLYDTLNGVKLQAYTAGNNICTVGEIGGTSKRIITAGAYTTKHEYVDINGTIRTTRDSLNQLAYFSSRGPTVDGRTKPEITAPGERIVSSVNSYSPAYKENSIRTVLKVENQGAAWYFAALQGTSMSTPMTTGIIALMLQANHLLNPEQVKQMLKNNARTDSYTGTIPPEGSNSWGWGKIDARKSVKAAFESVGIEEAVNPEFTVFPNPSPGIVFLKKSTATGQTSEIIVRNIFGATVNCQLHTWSLDCAFRLDLSGYPAGIYLIRINNGLDQPEHLKVLIGNRQ